MTLTPKISIIVPIYNAEQWLERCVDSIVAQTYTDWELLLIDDGSTDRSGDICDRYAASDPRIQAFHKPNGGVSSARNLGLDHAQGEWITFVDSDDYVFPCWLENFIYNSSGVDMVVQGFKTPYAYEPIYNKDVHGVSYKGSGKEGLLELFKNKYLGYLWVKLFRTDIIRENHIRFDTKISLQEDEDFVLQYATYTRQMVSIEDIGYMYFPPFRNKYKDIKNWFYMTQRLFENSLTLYGKEWNDLVSYYLNYYTDALIDIYEKKQENRRKCLKVYRKVTGELLLKSRLFFLSRWLCFFDYTNLLSSLILDIHTILHPQNKQ